MISSARVLLYRFRVALCTAIVIIASFLTYLPSYDKPQALFWDENYHIASAQHYLNGDFFMEMHPPLGKLLIALGEYALKPNERFDQFRDTDHGKGDLLPSGFSFAGYRLIPTILAWLTAPLLFLTALLISGRVIFALLAAALYTFDNAIIVHARAAMLEGTQLFFIVAALLCFFAIVRGILGDRYRPLAAVILGAALGAAIGTKVNALLFAALIPLLLVAPGPRRSRIGLIITTAVSLGLVYTTVWYLHFSIARERNVKLKESGYYTKDTTIRHIIDRPGPLGAKDFVVLMKANAIDYLAHYSKGVPSLDLCKTGENGSPVFMWPFGGRAIQYRWEAAGENMAKYLYLVANPVGWGIGLTSLVLAASLLLASAFASQAIRLKKFWTILLLVSLYGAYMLAMGRITRVMYLYHYLIPLLLTYLVASIMVHEVERVGPVIITNRRKSYFVTVCIGLTFLSYLWYSPFTYYKPISDRGIADRALLSFWDLRCAGCPRTNFIASGGKPLLFTPRFAVSGVKPTIVKQGWGQPRVGFSVNGTTIKAAGIHYPSCFGMHSNATLSYPVHKQFSRLTGHAGLPDYVAGTTASVSFMVQGDGKVLWQSPTVRGGEPALNINVDISGVNNLSLRITDAEDGITHDHGFWANLKFEKEPGAG